MTFSSCSTPTNIAYFQDADLLDGIMVQGEQQFLLRPGDKINIVVNSSNPMLEQQFTLKTATNQSSTLGLSVTPRTVSGKTTGSGSQLIAYTVDEQGTITFPVLGKIPVMGKTRKQVADYIQIRLITRSLVDDPIVTVEYVNLGVSVLGEVKSPGRIEITQDSFTIIDALASAGDLTIDGMRENVLVARQVNGVNHVYFIDLTDMKSLLKSPAYYLQQNDLVYVSPSDKRLREAKASGNTLYTPGFWMSLASFAMSVVTFVLALR